MAYGLTLEQVRNIDLPIGIPASWGSTTSITQSPLFSMSRFELRRGGSQPLRFFDRKVQLFVEEGTVFLRALDPCGVEQVGKVESGQTFALMRFAVHALASETGASVYLFCAGSDEPLVAHLAEEETKARGILEQLRGSIPANAGEPTTDIRAKYWGKIETILNEDVAAKRIFIRKGGQSSLEYHVEKTESYYIHSGLLRLGLRIGRAENHSVIMRAGESYCVRPGVMHMRMALEDTVILESSTRDSDSDSYLVEDGQTYQHIDADAQPTITNQ